VILSHYLGLNSGDQALLFWFFSQPLGPRANNFVFWRVVPKTFGPPAHIFGLELVVVLVRTSSNTVQYWLEERLGLSHYLGLDSWDQALLFWFFSQTLGPRADNFVFWRVVPKTFGPPAHIFGLGFDYCRRKGTGIT